MVICAKGAWAAVLCAAMGAMLPRPASAIELLTNGNFEAAPVNGYAPGWTHFEQAGSIGQFYLDAPGTTTPAADPAFRLGTPTNSLTPGGGNTYAVGFNSSDTVQQTGSAAYSLAQSFSLPGNATGVTLRYQFFARDYQNLGEFVDPAGLDYTVGAPNFHARIDILRGGASPLSTNPADIVRTIKEPFTKTNNQNNNEEWQASTFNITNDVSFGQNYTIRFAAVTNQQSLAFGVDNVSLDYVGSVIIPEANTAGLMALSLLFFSGLYLVQWHVKRRE